MLRFVAVPSPHMLLFVAPVQFCTCMLLSYSLYCSTEDLYLFLKSSNGLLCSLLLLSWPYTAHLQFALTTSTSNCHLTISSYVLFVFFSLPLLPISWTFLWLSQPLLLLWWNTLLLSPFLLLHSLAQMILSHPLLLLSLVPLLCCSLSRPLLFISRPLFLLSLALLLLSWPWLLLS
jgi:hypothetical protein